MGMEPSLDPDVACDVQMSKNALPETCSVLEPRGVDALCRETMKAWHHLWHSLGATESQIQCLILLNAEMCMREEAEAIEVCPPLPQALSIKGDVTLGIPHSRLLGRKW